MTIRTDSPLTVTLIVALLLLPSAAAAATNPAAAPVAPEVAGSSDGATFTEPTPVELPSASSRLLGALVATNTPLRDPLPLPEPDAERPLAAALQRLQDATGGAADAEALKDAQERADLLPTDLQRALALVVLATADAAEVSRASVGEDGAADRAEVARGALLMAHAIDEAQPVLRKYAILYESGAVDASLENARVVDEVLAITAGTRPLPAPAEAPRLQDAVLDLYGTHGLDATTTDKVLLRKGADALPRDVERAAAILIAAQVESTRLRAEALEGLTARDAAILNDPAYQAALHEEPTGESLARMEAYLAAAGKVDHGKLARSSLLLATATLQAKAILADGAPEDAATTDESPSALMRVWEGIKRLVSKIIPVGTARAQADWNGEACPQWSPLQDCENDVWFMDPFGIVVVSGYGTTAYDDRYGRLTVKERGTWTLERLPTDGTTVRTRDLGLTYPDTEVRGDEARSRWERNGGAANTKETNALARPYYVASLDLGGNDVYTNHTASTDNIVQFIQRATGHNVTARDAYPGAPSPLGLADFRIPVPNATGTLGALPFQAKVLVDLAGNDQYAPGPVRKGWANLKIAVAGPGAAVLLDASGDDTYTAGEQSIGTAAFAGAAMLLDLDGRDSYRAGNQSLGASFFLATALVLDDCAQTPAEACAAGNDTYFSRQYSQAMAAFGGVASLVDRGGDDAYVHEWDKDNPFNSATTPNVQGYAQTTNAYAVFADLGGTNDTGIHPHERHTSIGIPYSSANASAEANDGEVGVRVWINNTGRIAAGIAVDFDYTPDPTAYAAPGSGIVARWGETTVPFIAVPGLFAVDGVTNSLYTDPYAVLVDLRGRDTYRNNAGATLPHYGEASSIVDSPNGLNNPAYDNGRTETQDKRTHRYGQTMGAALLLDVGGHDTYDARHLPTERGPLDPRGVQGVGDQGVGMLVDLGTGRDRYRAKDLAQGAGVDGGVGVLLDDGATGSGDVFEAGNFTQGAAGHNAIGALIALGGPTAYSAWDKSQGYGEKNGTGILADAERAMTDDANDRYKARVLSQGAAASGGMGLLVDAAGDDWYAAKNLAQGYAIALLEGSNSLAGVAFTTNETRQSRGVLIDVSGRDHYEASAEPAKVHGFADRTHGSLPIGALGGSNKSSTNMSDVRATALLLDFTMPTTPQPGADAGSYLNEYDAWMREGQGDVYLPVTTFDDEGEAGKVKSENAYWEQPAPPANGVNTEVFRVGRGMDNPPVASYLMGVNGSFAGFAQIKDLTAGVLGAIRFDGSSLEHCSSDDVAAAWEVASRVGGTDDAPPGCSAQVNATDVTGPGIDLAALLVDTLTPSVDVSALETDCDGGAEPLSGEVCLSAEVSFLGGPGDAGGRAEADFYLTGANGTRIKLGTVTSSASTEGVDPSGLTQIGLPCPGCIISNPTRLLSVSLVTTELTLAVNTTVLRESADHPYRLERAWPDGVYTVDVEVRNVGHFLSGYRSEGHDSATFRLENPADVLGVDLLHPNPDAPSQGAVFNLLTTSAADDYWINVTTHEGNVVALNATTAPSTGTTCGLEGVEPVCRTPVAWNATVNGTHLPEGAYPYTVTVLNATHGWSQTYEGVLASDGDAPSGDLNLTYPYVGWPRVVDTDKSVDPPTRTVSIPLRGVDDGAGVDTFNVEVRVGNDRFTSNITGVQSPNNSSVYQGELMVPHVRHDTQIHLALTPVDRAGNAGATRARTVTVDLQRPAAETVVNTTTPGHQNSQVFPVGWTNASKDAREVHLTYRFRDIQNPGAPFKTYAVVTPADAEWKAGRVEWDAVAAGEVQNATDGADVEFEALAVDRAGNMQPASLPNRRLVRLDLNTPALETLDATAGLTTAEVSWSLTSDANVHKLTIHHPDGTAETQWKNVTATAISFTVEDLSPKTTYRYEAASRDAGGNWVTSGPRALTTPASLVAHFVSPAQGAPLRGAVPVRWTAGAADADDGGDKTVVWNLTATVVDADGNTTHRLLVPDTELFVRGAVDAPEEPRERWYPTVFNTGGLPDSGDVTLTLSIRNGLETVTATRRVTIDNTPPTTPSAGANLAGDAGGREGNLQWYRGPVVVEGFATSDALSGVNATYYGLNADNVTQRFDPAAPPRFAEDGVHTLFFRSVDAAGNEETSLNRLRFGIDTRAPDAEVLVAGATGVVDARNVTVQIVPRDADGGSGVVALRLAEGAAVEEAQWLPYDPGQVAYPLTLTGDDGPKRVAVQVMDAAGNVGRVGAVVHLETRAPALATALDVERAGYSDAILTWRTDKDSLTRLEYGVNGTFTRAVELDGLRQDHRVILDGLTPGASYVARAVLEDRVGNSATTDAISFATRSDGQPPTGVADVVVRDLRNGHLSVEWGAAGDDVAVGHYEVHRASGDGDFAQVATVEGTTYRDTTVTPGERYHYRVRAVDVAGNAGPMSDAAAATATTPPTLTGGAVTPEVGTPDAPFTFTVTYRDADGDVPAHVRVVVDGVPHDMAPDANGTPREGVRYTFQIELEETSLTRGAHTYHFTASDGRDSARWPAVGHETGPVVVSGEGAPGEGGGLPNVNVGGADAPAPGFALVALAGAAVALLRRWRQ